jgi:hypothetical protein
MKSNLAIAALIRSRMTELGLSRGEFAKRLGYKNIAKGIRPVILTERTVPSPIFVAAMIGGEKLLRMDLDATQGPASFVRQMLDRLPERVPDSAELSGL